MENATTTIAENRNTDTVVNSQMINLFVDEKKVKRNIIVPISNINGELIVTNTRQDGTGERFNATLQEKSAYLQCMEKSMDIKINIQGVRTIDRNIQYKILADGVDQDIVTVTRAINANPWNAGLLRHRTDPLNSMCQSTNVVLGNVGGSDSFDLNPQFVNVMRKLENQQVIKDAYKGALIPERQNLNYIVNASSDAQMTGFKMNGDGKTSGQLDGLKTYTCLSPVVELPRIQQNLQPQQFFDGAEYEFEKTIATKNYKWETNRLTPTEATKKLYTIKVGKYSYPTNIENWEAFLALPHSPGLAGIYYYTNKFALVSGRDVAGENGENEPVGQTMNITIKLSANSSILHPMLNTLPNLTFTNIQTFKIESTYHTDLFRHMFYNIYKPSDNSESLGVPKVTVSEQKLKITQIDCALLQNMIKPRVALNYIDYRVFSQTNKVRLVREGNKIGFKNTQFNINCGFTGHVPKKALIFVYSLENLPSSFADLKLTFAGQNGVIMQSIDDLITASRINGLDMSVNDQFNSYSVMTSFSNTKLVPSQCGHVLYLEYGNNLPIITNSTKPITASSYVDGLSADYKITVNGMFESDFTHLDMTKEYDIQLFIYHLNDGEAIFSSNSVTKKVLGFTDGDLASAIYETDMAVKSNELVVNVDDVVSAGSRAVHKIKRKDKTHTQTAPQSSTNGFMNDYIFKR